MYASYQLQSRGFHHTLSVQPVQLVQLVQPVKLAPAHSIHFTHKARPANFAVTAEIEAMDWFKELFYVNETMYKTNRYPAEIGSQSLQP